MIRGIISERVWKELRVQELKEVIQRYSEAGRIIRTEWLEEYNKHIKELIAESGGANNGSN